MKVQIDKRNIGKVVTPTWLYIRDPSQLLRGSLGSRFGSGNPLQLQITAANTEGGVVHRKLNFRVLSLSCEKGVVKARLHFSGELGQVSDTQSNIYVSGGWIDSRMPSYPGGPIDFGLDITFKDVGSTHPHWSIDFDQHFTPPLSNWSMRLPE